MDDDPRDTVGQKDDADGTMRRLAVVLAAAMAVGAPYAVQDPRWGRYVFSIGTTVLGAMLALWARWRRAESWERYAWLGLFMSAFGVLMLLMWAGIVPDDSYNKTISGGIPVKRHWGPRE